MRQLLERFQRDRRRDEGHVPVAKRENGAAGVRAVETADFHRRVRFVALRKPRVTAAAAFFVLGIHGEPGIPQRPAGARHPSQVIFLVRVLLADEHRMGRAVADVLVAHRAVQEEHAMIVRVDVGIHVVVDASVTGEGPIRLFRNAHRGTHEGGNVNLADGRILFVVHAHLEVDVVVGVLLLDVRQQAAQPVVVISSGLVDDRPFLLHRARWIGPVGHFVVLHGQDQLRQIIDARDPPRRLAGRLDRRQQQGHQDADDCNDHQQLDQRKRRVLSVSHGKPPGLSLGQR